MLSLRRSLTTTIAAAVLVGSPSVVASAAPSRATGAPRTLAAEATATGLAVTPTFRADFVAVTWPGAPGEAQVRFRHGGSWSAWEDMGEDGVEQPGMFGSALVPAHAADAYQVRVPAGVRNARTVAINTTDGPRTAPATTAPATTTTQQTTSQAPGTQTTAPASPAVVARAQWGADESLRFDAAGAETWPAEYFPVQKLTVHHTATANGDPDPAATVRAIYRYHAIDRGWGDIGYQFLVDEAGRIYEGRHTDDDPTTPPAFDGAGRAVVGAHVAGWNSGNVGVSLLGTLTDRRPTAAAQRALERLLAYLAARTGISATGSGTYTNPVDGSTWTGPNIPGHRDFAATECPGGVAYALLPTIRQRVAERVAGTLVEDTTSPALSAVRAVPGGTTATVTWTTTADPSDSQVQYWRKTTPGSVATVPLDLRFVTAHRIVLSGLRRGASYGYRVLSADLAGNRAVSATAYVTVR